MFDLLLPSHDAVREDGREGKGREGGEQWLDPESREQVGSLVSWRLICIYVCRTEK
jgi:hypothetical protein